MIASRFTLFALLTVLVLPGQVAAQAGGGMVLNRAIVVFKPGFPPREDVTVLNQDEENLYVNIEIIEVINPGSDEENRVKVTDPGQAGLIVTPNRMIVPPLGRKTFRLVNLGSGDGERIFRVNVTPVLPPLQETDTSMVRVVVAYQLLVVVQPQQPTEELQVRREDRQLLFENKGNTNILISEGAQCDSDGESCRELPTKRIYAGNSYQVDLEYDTPVTYKLTASDASRQAVYE